MNETTVTLSPALVRWSYRFLLGRDPESDTVIEAWCGAGSLAGLREGILVSPEMAALAMTGFPERGSWIDNQPTDEAAGACLLLRDGVAPDDAAVVALRLRCPSLRGLRGFLLNSPSIAQRLPRPEGPRARTIRILGQDYTLKGDSRDPEFIAAPGFATRWAALLRAAWPDGGAGRVLVDGGAGIGVTALGLAAGAPGHARLIAYEASLRQAAALSENLLENGLSKASARAVAMEHPAKAMESDGLRRLDFLRINAPGATQLAPELAGWLLERGTLAVMSFDLPQLLVQNGPSPRALLANCLAAFPHVIGFDAAHEPVPLLDDVELDAALQRVLMRPDRRDEFLLCADLDWLERYRTG